MSAISCAPISKLLVYVWIVPYYGWFILYYAHVILYIACVVPYTTRLTGPGKYNVPFQPLPQKALPQFWVVVSMGDDPYPGAG
jgi:hypothetical protein